MQSLYIEMLKDIGIESAKMQQGAAKAGDDTDV